MVFGFEIPYIHLQVTCCLNRGVFAACFVWKLMGQCKLSKPISYQAIVKIGTYWLSPLGGASDKATEWNIEEENLQNPSQLLMCGKSILISHTI